MANVGNQRCREPTVKRPSGATVGLRPFPNDPSLIGNNDFLLSHMLTKNAVILQLFYRPDSISGFMSGFALPLRPLPYREQ